MSDIVDDDSARLHSLGYAQELKRGMGTFSNLAISFSIISILFVSPLFPQRRWWNSDEVNSATFTGPMILLSFVGGGL